MTQAKSLFFSGGQIRPQHRQVYLGSGSKKRFPIEVHDVEIALWHLMEGSDISDPSEEPRDRDGGDPPKR